MATDYKQISNEHEKRYGWDKKPRRIFKELYSDRTHFIYELIQNADDNKSSCIAFRLYNDKLLVWNDGTPFTQEDVKKICSLYASNKDLTQIGTFGIGFKAVYTYSDAPEIYSGDERFKITDLIFPEEITEIEMSSKGIVIEQVDKGRTVFCLPFKDKIHDDDIKQLRNRFSQLNMRTLLFLQHLKTIQWCDVQNKLQGSYNCHRHPHDKIQDATKVELTMSHNNNQKSSEEFLVFRNEILPPGKLIKELLEEEDFDGDRERIQRSAQKPQHVEVAFKIQDDRIIGMDNCVLYAFLPTFKETHFRFLIQARYQTTPARDNITCSPWNKWLLKQTEDFLPAVLEQLKSADLLTPTFFNVLPLPEDNIPEEYNSIFNTIHKILQEKPYIPTQNGELALAENVLDPHTKILRELVKEEWMKEKKWLHPEIRNTKEMNRCFKIMEKARVRKYKIEDFLGWLRRTLEKNKEWIENRCDDWLCLLYIYLHEQKSKLKEIKDIPLIRLENGSHKSTHMEPVFFPPERIEEIEEIDSFISELPIIKASLLKDDTSGEIKRFLKTIGVSPLSPENLIKKFIIPEYTSKDKVPTIDQNRHHINFLQYVLSDKKTGLKDLKLQISETKLILAYREERPEKTYFIKPCETYLTQAFTGNTDLETYFSGKDNTWFIDAVYLDNNTDKEIWLRFLKMIGVMDSPRSPKKAQQEYLDGLQEVLEKIYTDQDQTLSLTLWRILVDCLNSLDETNYTLLREKEWVPDKEGNFYRPTECFIPSIDNRAILGDSVVYLHPDIDISQDNKESRSLAKKLGVHLNADTDSVMVYLQTLSGSSIDIEDIIPIYDFLNLQNALPRDKFQEHQLIFTPTSEPYWWKSNKVFWYDESVLFEDNRGYLKDIYPEEQKAFFISLGVSERAAPLDYIRGIKEISSNGQTDDPNIRKRIYILYDRLLRSIQEGGKWKETKEWEQTLESKCWLGKIGDEWGFFTLKNLVWNDHTLIAEIFDGIIPFFGNGDELIELAKIIGIEACSQARISLTPNGNQERDTVWSDKVQNLHLYIHAFLNSPGLCKTINQDKTASDLEFLSVSLADVLEVKYILKEVPIISTDTQKYLEISNQNSIIWLSYNTDKNDNAMLIGDAIQDYFNVKDLGRFIEHLLTRHINTVLDHWKRKGLQSELIHLPTEDDENSHVKPVGATNVNDKIPKQDEAMGVVQDEVDTGPDKKNENSHEPIIIKQVDSKDDQIISPLYPPNPTSNGQVGGIKDKTVIPVIKEESSNHKHLKEYIAYNPTELDQRLRLVKIEYSFKSNDRVDILMADSNGNPVPVEVEIGFYPDNWEIGVWQAAKYKHLAAAEFGLSCEQVRSILVAPEIPEDVKAKCSELGIEPIEVRIPYED
ncbi:hypothetical protein JT359_02765 [Candidatus Poribacteria bacterium]|nr:hypothetical protein [Candidatus Poribacteria bacterium]